MEYRVTWLPFAALTWLVVMLLGGDSGRLAPDVPEGIPAEALCDSPECAYYADGGVETVPGQVLTLIMGMRWNGSYWQVLGVAVT